MASITSRVLYEYIENPAREEMRTNIKTGSFGIEYTQTNMGMWVSSITEASEDTFDYDVAEVYYGDNAPELHLYNFGEFGCPVKKEDLGI